MYFHAKSSWMMSLITLFDSWKLWFGSELHIHSQQNLQSVQCNKYSKQPCNATIVHTVHFKIIFDFHYYTWMQTTHVRMHTHTYTSALSPADLYVLMICQIFLTLIFVHMVQIQHKLFLVMTAMSHHGNSFTHTHTLSLSSVSHESWPRKSCDQLGNAV